MSCLIVSDDYVIITKGLQIDCYNQMKHNIINIPVKSKLEEKDNISDIAISPNRKYLALITLTSKRLILQELPLSTNHKSFDLTRSASKVRFTTNSERVLIADKSGDVLIYDIKDGETGIKLLGHLSLLLDILQTNNEKFIITADRDEKIRVSCYPNTYNIQTYCLGHKEFVNHIELLPHDNTFLTSTSGDGTVKCWNYEKGTLCYSIDTFFNVNEIQLKEDFIKKMDEDGIEVCTLPIVHYAVTQQNENSSLLAITVHNYSSLLIYSLQTVDNQFVHKLEHKLPLQHFPTAITFHKSSLYIYNDTDCVVQIYKLFSNSEVIEKIKMFENEIVNIDSKENNFDSIKMLYKRKFDNVQEYQERKKQRLEKSSH